MTTSRVLTMVERRVPGHERLAFLTEVDARRDAAAAVRAHVWVFEHSNEPGRFVEFIEAADEHALAAVTNGEMSAPLWREVQAR